MLSFQPVGIENYDLETYTGIFFASLYTETGLTYYQDCVQTNNLGVSCSESPIFANLNDGGSCTDYGNDCVSRSTTYAGYTVSNGDDGTRNVKMNSDDFYQPFDFLSANGISADNYNSGYNAEHGFIGLGPKSTFWADLMEGAIGGGFTVGMSVSMNSNGGTILMGARESSYTGTEMMQL
jgi:hypothetical protein